MITTHPTVETLTVSAQANLVNYLSWIVMPAGTPPSSTPTARSAENRRYRCRSKTTSQPV
jgi:hypothetical protein